MPGLLVKMNLRRILGGVCTEGKVRLLVLTSSNALAIPTGQIESSKWSNSPTTQMRRSFLLTV